MKIIFIKFTFFFRRLRKETQVCENLFGFIPRRLTMKAIYLLQRMIFFLKIL